MIPFRKSIGFRLFAISFILTALPLLIDSFILIQKNAKHSIGNAKSYLVEVSRLRELPLSYLRPLDQHLVLLISNSLNLEAGFPEKENPKLNQKLKEIAQVGDFTNIFLIKITPEGKYVAIASGKEEELGKDFTQFFQLNKDKNSKETGTNYSANIFYDPKTQKPFYIATQAFYSKTNEPVGMIAVLYDLSTRLKELLEPDTENFKISFAILLPSTMVFAASDPKLAFQYFSPLSSSYKELFKKDNPFAAKLVPDAPLKVHDTIGFPFFEFSWQGEEQVGYIQKMENVNFSLLAYASKKDIYKPPLSNFWKIYSIYLFILVFGGLISWFLIKRMAKPIQNLSKVMLDIQKGDLQSRYKPDVFGFEINSLGSIFNEMIDRLIAHKHLAEEERVQKETLAKELRLGQQVQRTLLPQAMPKFKGVDLAEMYVPAIEVGGDFYDVFVKKVNGQDLLALAIADASGKGVRACFYSLSLRNMMRIFTKEFSDVSKAMRQANNLFCKDTGDSGMFVTAIMGIYDQSTHIFDYLSCGHNSPIVMRKDGKIEFLNHQCVAIGVFPFENELNSHSVHLDVGDTLILYTDGITEAHDIHNNLYGEERLKQCLSRSKEMGARDIVKNIVQDVNSFASTKPQHDDITLLVMKILE